MRFYPTLTLHKSIDSSKIGSSGCFVLLFLFLMFLISFCSCGIIVYSVPLSKDRDITVTVDRYKAADNSIEVQQKNDESMSRKKRRSFLRFGGIRKN